MAKPKKRAKESRLVYVPFVAAAVIVALLVVLAFVKPPATNTTQTNGSFPFLQFVKVSDRDYASSPTRSRFTWSPGRDALTGLPSPGPFILP